MDSFYKTYQHLVEHLGSPIRRKLMDEINWNDRLIGIKGPRGVGKTTFLLQYAKDNFKVDNKKCLYINLDNFYFNNRSLVDFADEFRMKGGEVLLIDQIFKNPDWSKNLAYCYDHISDLKIVFTGSSVMNFSDEESALYGKVTEYNLRGFSFREFLNIVEGSDFRSYTLDEIMHNHKELAEDICSRVKPLAYKEDYTQHGFYPFFLEKGSYSENLLKNMNMMLDIDVSYILQMEQSYLPKLKKLLFLLAAKTPVIPNVTQLSAEIETSRATVMNYIKYLKDSRLINLLYSKHEEYPKKPNFIYLQNPNLIFSMRQIQSNDQAVLETFFYNQVSNDHHVSLGRRNARFLVDNKYNFNVLEAPNGKYDPHNYYAVEGIEKGTDNVIPIWLFGFLY